MAALGPAWGRWFFRHFVRPPSPPPVYDKGGNRLNTRDVRIRRGHRARRGPKGPCFELGTIGTIGTMALGSLVLISAEFHRVAGVFPWCFPGRP